MEVKVSGSGDAARGASSPTASGAKKRPPSRLQKQAPASLQLEQGAAGAGPGAGAWGDGRAAIPLLSPLVTSPATPVWEADRSGAGRREGGGEQADGRNGGEQQQRGAARHGGSGERQAHDASPRPSATAPAAGGGWRHPALTTPVAEPASLVPLFKSQCAVEARNAPQ